MARAGQAVTRFALLESVWDSGYDNRSNIIDVYVRYLRDKVDRPFGVESIETVRGVGYRLRGMGAMSRLPIRARLTVVFAAVMALVLAGTGLLVLGLVGRQLDRSADSGLRCPCGRGRGVAARQRCGPGARRGQQLANRVPSAGPGRATAGATLTRRGGSRGRPLLTAVQLPRRPVGARVRRTRRSRRAWTGPLRVLAEPVGSRGSTAS